MKRANTFQQKTEGVRKTNSRLEKRTHGSRYVRESDEERK